MNFNFFYFIINKKLIHKFTFKESYTNYNFEKDKINEEYKEILNKLDDFKPNEKYILFNNNNSWYVFNINDYLVYIINFDNKIINENYIMKIILKMHDNINKLCDSRDNFKDESIINEIINQEVNENISILVKGELSLSCSVVNTRYNVNENHDFFNNFKNLFGNLFKNKIFLIVIVIILNILIIILFIFFVFN